MRSMACLPLRFMVGAAVVLTLASPSASTWSAGPAADPLPLSGPFPTHQWVGLWVPSVDVTRDPGFFEEGVLEVQMYFELDATPCPSFDLDKVTVFPALASWPDDCRYADLRRRDFDVSASHVHVNVDVRLPAGEVSGDGPAGEPQPMLRIFRYSDQVRVSVWAREWDPFGPYDFMGGAVAKFGPRSHFGLGMNRDPLVAGDAQYSFDTCGVSGSCFDTTFHMRVVPAPAPRGRNLQVDEVVGPERCVVGEPFTWSVSLSNPHPAPSGPYVSVIALLDAEGRLVRAWYSATQTPIGPSRRAASVAIPGVRLPPGQNELAVFAQSIEASPLGVGESRGEIMATAMETAIHCLPRVTERVEEVVIPGESPVPSPRIFEPGIGAPRATATPAARVPGIEAATPTVRLGRPELETLFSSPTPTARARLPEFERVPPTATPTPVVRGPGTSIRAPAPTPTPEEPDMRSPFLR